MFFQKPNKSNNNTRKHHKIRTKFPKRIKKKQYTTRNQTLHLLFTSFNKEKPAMMNIRNTYYLDSPRHVKIIKSAEKSIILCQPFH